MKLFFFIDKLTLCKNIYRIETILLLKIKEL